MDKYLSYYFIVNILNFILFAIDKKKAIEHKYRIPEFWLFFISIMGGALGGILSMNIMKHKNSKINFAIGMPVLLIVNFLSWFYLSSFL